MRIPTGDSCSYTACSTLSAVYARIVDLMYAYIKHHTLVRRAKSLKLQATHKHRAPSVHWVPNARHPSARTHAVRRRSTCGLCEVVQSACAHFYTRVSREKRRISIHEERIGMTEHSAMIPAHRCSSRPEDACGQSLDLSLPARRTVWRFHDAYPSQRYV